MEILAPVPVGDLFDRITVLRLKRDRIADPAKQAAVAAYLSRLEQAAEAVPPSAELTALVAALQAVNAELWDIEDAKRRHEAEQRFDDAFVQLARRVYLRNDDRAAIKRAIDGLTGSGVIEVKSHG